MRRLEAEDSEVPNNELIERILRNVGLRVQKYYMRQESGLYMGLNTSAK
jgi:hypothetical protein